MLGNRSLDEEQVSYFLNDNLGRRLICIERSETLIKGTLFDNDFFLQHSLLEFGTFLA